MENNIIILEDEQGNEVEFAVVDVFELEGETFFALEEILPEGEETDEILIMVVEGDINDDTAELVMVEDEDLLRRAFDEFVKREESGE